MVKLTQFPSQKARVSASGSDLGYVFYVINKVHYTAPRPMCNSTYDLETNFVLPI